MTTPMARLSWDLLYISVLGSILAHSQYTEQFITEHAAHVNDKEIYLNKY